QIIVIGGGTAGTTVAASLLDKRPSLNVAVIEPSDTHYYQPAFTLVGGGTYNLEDTSKPQVQTLPRKATWIQDAVSEILPDKKQLRLADDTLIQYEYLVVAAGI